VNYCVRRWYSTSYELIVFVCLVGAIVGRMSVKIDNHQWAVDGIYSPITDHRRSTEAGPAPRNARFFVTPRMPRFEQGEPKAKES
jgi:hypothetical protein